MVGAELSRDSASRVLFSAAKVGSLEVKLGGVVSLSSGQEDEEEVEEKAEEGASSILGLVVALYKDEDGDLMAQV